MTSQQTQSSLPHSERANDTEMIFEGSMSKDEVMQALRDAMHDVREFNRVIRANSEMLGQLLEVEKPGQPLNLSSTNSDNARQQLVSIMQTAQMLSARLNLIDLETNPSVFDSESTYAAGIYAKFDKAKKILKMHASRERVSITFEGSSFRKYDVYSVFDALPFLVLENAIKYAPSDSDIVVSFIELPERLEVSVKSMGPMVKLDEVDSLFDKNFRGEFAVRASPKGNGFGLYFADFIAKLHGFEIKANCGDAPIHINGIPYASFEIVLIVRQQ